MIIDKRCALVLLAALLAIRAAWAQETAAAPKPQPPKIHLDVVVAAKGGAPVAGLQQQDFKVLDNKTPQPITSFQAFHGGETPVEVVLAIDAVNTSYQTIAFERGEIAKFLLANGGHLAQPTALAVITDTGTKMQEGFSTDGAAINAALTGYDVALREIRRSAGVYGAEERLQTSLKAARALIELEAAHPGRKIIIWLSPGWPLLSGPGVQLDSKAQHAIFATIVDLSTMLRRSRTTFYSVNPLGASENLGHAFYYQAFDKGVARVSQAEPGDLGVQVLATQSGGLVLNSTAVADLLHQCIADTLTYYELTFVAEPAEKPDEYHHIEVQIAKPGLTARTLQGYYAQP